MSKPSMQARLPKRLASKPTTRERRRSRWSKQGSSPHAAIVVRPANTLQEAGCLLHGEV